MSIFVMPTFRLLLPLALAVGCLAPAGGVRAGPVPAAQLPAATLATGSRYVQPLPDDRLYRAFGGEFGMRRVVSGFVQRLLAHPDMGPMFKDVKLDRLRQTLFEQFCVVAGGPCTYTGDDMHEVHKGLDLDKVSFNQLVEALQGAMDEQAIDFAAQRQLLARLAPMHREVLTR